jgi:hypothetical protein
MTYQSSPGLATLRVENGNHGASRISCFYGARPLPSGVTALWGSVGWSRAIFN